MDKINDTAILQYICQTAEMGVDSIKDVLQYAKGQSIRKELGDQRKEYDQIYSEGYSLLTGQGQKPKDVSRFAKVSARMTTKAETLRDRSNSKIAEMMITGNTMGMTKSIQHLNQYQGHSEPVRTLAVKLLRTEESNIERMKSFL